MKANEISFRQNRVVYTLMLLLAGLGLFWGFWQHQHKDEPAVPASAAQAAPGQTTAATASFSR